MFINQQLINNTNQDLQSFIIGTDAYRFGLKKFNDWLFNQQTTFNYDAILAYRDELVLSGATSSKVNIFVYGIKKRLREMLETQTHLSIEEVTQIERLLKKIKPVKKASSIVSMDACITDQEYKKLITEAPEDLSLVLKFMYATGVRVSELLSIRYSDCQIKGDKVDIRILGKGEKERFVRVPVQLFTSIDHLFTGEAFLFIGEGILNLNRIKLYTRIKRLSLKILGRVVTPHMLRHTFATRMIRQTGKIKAVSTYLGHSSTSLTLDMYTHEQLTDDDLFCF